MRLQFFIVVFMCCLTAAHAGQLQLQFKAMVGGEKLKLDGSKYFLPATDSISFETFRFYLSSFRFFKGNQQVWQEKESYHLLDAADDASMQLNFELPDSLHFDHILFTLGIDSVTNARGVGNGDLDPMHGMYWAWQSGYINMKLEGTSPLCATRKQMFHFHLGGFLNGFNCAQQVQLEASGNSSIFIHLEELLSHLSLSKTPTVMTPGEEAVQLSLLAAKIFSTQP